MLSSPLIFAIFALVQVSNWAHDEASGRFDLVLATPQSRARMLLAHYAAFATALLAMAAALLAATTVAAAQQDLALDGGRLVEAVVGILPIVLVVGSLGYLISTWLRAGAVAGVLGGFLALSLAVELLGPLFNWPDIVLQFSIFQHYGSPLVEGLQWRNMVGLLGLAALVLTLAMWRFVRKDIAS